jgi:hypothetical protein
MEETMTIPWKLDDALTVPHLPECPKTSVDGLSFVSIRDRMTRIPPNIAVERAILSVIEQWLNDPRSVEPIRHIQSLMDSMRALPRGEERLSQMNSFVRTLGKPQVLGTFLDMMRESSGRVGTREQELSWISQNASKHCLYGWCGQTLLILSSTETTEGTLEPEPGVRELFLGESPPAVWGLSMHIWQPNPHAKGFESGRRIEPGIILEPPHSHPFDFASMVVIGEMYQSIYAQRDSRDAFAQVNSAVPAGRYDGVKLEHVDGVWPPHNHRSSCELFTLEERVPLRAGDSYYMPCDKIHDVELEAITASKTPTITLFLGSEAVVKPHVFMAPSMADFHELNPDLKHSGRALAPKDWHAKFQAVASYLRGKNPTLNLDNIVRHEGGYAFFHV